MRDTERAPRQAPGARPDNAPICPIVDASGKNVFVTLRRGGLFGPDATQTPMQIVADYCVVPPTSASARR